MTTKRAATISTVTADPNLVEHDSPIAGPLTEIEAEILHELAYAREYNPRRYRAVLRFMRAHAKTARERANIDRALARSAAGAA